MGRIRGILGRRRWERKGIEQEKGTEEEGNGMDDR